ncbi:MAG: type II secretion system protein J [Candidatus Methylacidiphilales bacterium]|nr:hypothetical protein [Candidatus Methylacidiphilales bacterium]
MKLVPRIGIRNPRARSTIAFTLVELMVSMLVLTLVLGLLFQIFSGTVGATQNSHRQMAATRQARMVLDPLRKDLQSIVSQGEAGTVYVKPDPQNCTLAFITRNRGPQGVADLRFLAVAYVLTGTEVTRKSNPVTWTQADLMTQALSAVSATTITPLSGNIVRWQFMAVLDNGNTVPLTTAGSWRLDKVQDTPVPGGFYALRLADGVVSSAEPKVRSLIVAVAAVDESILRLPNTTNLSTALTEPPANKTPHETWSGLINAGALNSFPVQTVSTMRIVQVTLPLR